MKRKPIRHTSTGAAFVPPPRIDCKSDDTVMEYQRKEGDVYIYQYTNRFTASGRRSTKYGTTVPLREIDIKNLLYWQSKDLQPGCK